MKTYYRLCTIVASALVLTAVSLAAQPLDSLVRLATDTYPTAAAARIAIRQADARAASAAAWDAPRIGVEFSMLPPSEPDPFSRGETMMMVEQMIPLFGQNKAMARAMSAEAAIGEAELAAVQRDIRARVEREYYTLWLLDRRAELNAESREIADLMYQAVEAGYEVGRAAQSDLLTATVERERLATELQLLAEERREALARLNTLLMRPVQTPLIVGTALPEPELIPAEELEQRLAVHPEVKKMEAMAAMNRSTAEAQEAMLMPMLMVRGGISYMPEGHPVREGNVTAHGVAGMDEGVMRFGLTAGAMLSLPAAPWSRGAAEGQAEVARLEAAESLVKRDAMLAEMRGMLHTNHAQARRAALSLDYYTHTYVPLLEQTLAALQNDYTTGRVPFSAVMNGYSMLVMARMDIYMKRMEYAMALSMIGQLTGELQ